MTLTTLMQGHTPNPAFAGIVTNDDNVLAIDVSEQGNAEVGAYAVAQGAIESVDAQMSPETSDKTYIRAGKTTTKTATQRTFKLSGDRMIGDAFQDFVCSHAIKFGVGQKVIRNYVFFSLLTGKGEKGTASIIVNSDGSGSAGETATVDIDIQAVKAPEEYTFVAVGG